MNINRELQLHLLRRLFLLPVRGAELIAIERRPDPEVCCKISAPAMRTS